MDVSARLVETLGAYPERLAPFLHVCLQSGCDATLARMGRPYDVAAYARMARMARAAVPSLALGTDVITGFPGETEAEFQQSLSFCRDMAFANMHVFRYSPRPLTPAADAPDQVSAQDKAARSARLRALARDLRREAARARLGTEELVVVESRGRGVTGGLFDVRVSPAAQVGSMVRARPTSLLDDGSLLAELL
ncbi:hypothetical protein [Olsenella sp. HMSC062G07]|uniref:hypothetical protein n=1 Tax=Olsenella sp. HMSC062G07 TaxID=1739330 RepID=UPI000AAC1FAE|nr:hypothetical protein [Olsenella sp. HMSC062G07]